MAFSSASHAATALRSTSDATRMEAAEYLFELGSDAAPALPEIIEGLKDSERLVVYHCAKALGRIGPKAVTAIPRLLAILKDPHADTNDRSAAAQALAGIGIGSVQHLTAALGDGDFFVRQEAAYALGQLGPRAKVAVPQLIRVLSDPVEMVRLNARAALQYIGSASIPALEQSLADTNAMRRANVGCVLLKLNPRSPLAIRGAVAALTDRDPLVRLAATHALRNAGAHAEPVIPEMVEALRTDNDDFVRMSIAAILSEMNPPRANTRHALLAAINDPFPGVREWSARGLGRMRPVSREAIAALSFALEHDKDLGVRVVSTQILGECGPHARVVLPLLRRVLQCEKDEELREATEEAIVAISSVYTN